MSPYNPNDQQRMQPKGLDPMQPEPSMSAPSPMPGRPAATYVRPEQPASQATWQSPQQQSWSQPQSGVQQGYMPPPGYQYRQSTPSQGIPGGQLPPQQYGWQQGYQPPQQSYPQGYQQPAGRGWTQPYPVQPQQNQNWQGGYQPGPWSSGYTPEYNQPAQSMPPAHGGKGGNGGSRRNLMLVIAAAAVVLLVVLITSVSNNNRRQQDAALLQAVAAYNERYCEGVYVDGIHLGGMTREEARTAVQHSAQLKCDEWNVALMTPTGEYMGEINSYHLGMTVHVDDALNEAWLQGHTGATAQEKKAAMDALRVEPFHTSTALPSGNTADVDRILGEIAASVYIPATDAAITKFNPNAKLEHPFVISEESVGRALDVESIKAQMYDMVSRMESGTFVIEPTPLYPTYTKAQLEQATTLIASHYTRISTTSTPERNDNIKRACELITGKVVMPGESFSFNGVVGARTKKNGFKIATVYEYGKEEQGYGGGICQVSSTIYVAAVRANLEITKRSQHGLVVGYTDLGLDATVNYDGRKIDFAFRNNTSSPIYIITKVMKKPQIDRSRDLVICEIYGQAPEPGVTYDLVAIQTELPIPVATMVPDKKAEHVIYTDETVTVAGRIGYEVDSYKVKYVNGEEVERTHMYHDLYEPVAPVIYTGVSERPITTIGPW